MQQHGSKYLVVPTTPLRPREWGQTILPATPLPQPGGGVTIQLFQNMAVMLHIKLNVIAKTVTCKHIFCPGVGSKVKTILFLK